MKKEQVYDEQISPLMDKIISICEENKIDMVATFCLEKIDDDELLCTTLINRNNSRVITGCKKVIFDRHVTIPPVIPMTITTK